MSAQSPLQFATAANQHRPTDQAVLAREAQKLARQGLTERDVGQALQLDPSAVRRLLEGDHRG